MQVNIARKDFLERQTLTLTIPKSNEIDESKVIKLMQEALKLCIQSHICLTMYQTDKEYIVMLESKDIDLITVVWLLEKIFPNINFNY